MIKRLETHSQTSVAKEEVQVKPLEDATSPLSSPRCARAPPPSPLPKCGKKQRSKKQRSKKQTQSQAQEPPLAEEVVKPVEVAPLKLIQEEKKVALGKQLSHELKQLERKQLEEEKVIIFLCQSSFRTQTPLGKATITPF
jgi:hypothetical protein